MTVMPVKGGGYLVFYPIMAERAEDDEQAKKTGIGEYVLTRYIVAPIYGAQYSKWWKEISGEKVRKVVEQEYQEFSPGNRAVYLPEEKRWHYDRKRNALICDFAVYDSEEMECPF